MYGVNIASLQVQRQVNSKTMYINFGATYILDNNTLFYFSDKHYIRCYGNQ